MKYKNENPELIIIDSLYYFMLMVDTWENKWRPAKVEPGTPGAVSCNTISAGSR